MVIVVVNNENIILLCLFFSLNTIRFSYVIIRMILICIMQNVMGKTAYFQNNQIVE